MVTKSWIFMTEAADFFHSFIWLISSINLSNFSFPVSKSFFMVFRSYTNSFFPSSLSIQIYSDISSGDRGSKDPLLFHKALTRKSHHLSYPSGKTLSKKSSSSVSSKEYIQWLGKISPIWTDILPGDISGVDNHRF